MRILALAIVIENRIKPRFERTGKCISLVLFLSFQIYLCVNECFSHVFILGTTWLISALQKLEGCTGRRGNGITDGCEQKHMGAGNVT